MNTLKERILTIIEKNSRINIAELAVMLGTEEIEIANALQELEEDESLGLGIRYRWQFLTFRLDYAFKKNLSNWNLEHFATGRFAFDLSQTF